MPTLAAPQIQQAVVRVWGVNPRVHPADHMYLHELGHAGGDAHLALQTYYRTGLAVAAVQRQIIQWKFGGFDAVTRFLEFAAGYGRSVRFLLRHITAERVWVADIVPDAVAFQEQQFGVHGILSVTNPEKLTCDERFDCIFVTSLFTHLPRQRFVPWLRKLHSLLAPHGLLVFSVHDAALAPPGAMDGTELLFLEASEVPELDTREYGLTYVRESYVRSAIREAVGNSYRRLPRGLAGFQDLYLMSAGAGEDLSGTIPLPPLAGLDRCAVTHQRELTVAGWTVDPNSDGRHVEIRVSVDGEVIQRCAPGLPRPDVAAFHGQDSTEKFIYSGWECSCPLPEGAGTPGGLVVVEACTPLGGTTVVHIANLGDLVELMPEVRVAESVVQDMTGVEAGTLVGCHVDRPGPGMSCLRAEMEISGWVIGRRIPAVWVEIADGSGVTHRTPVGDDRDDVAAAHAGVIGARASGFHTTVELAEDCSSVLIRAVLADGSPVPVGEIRLCGG